MLLVIFQNHNNQIEKLIGKDYSASTPERYRTAKKHIAEYIRKEYNVNDIPSKLTSLTIIQFINKFVFDRNIYNLKISII